MKRWLVFFLALSLLLCGCSKAEKKATLVLTCYDHNIVQELTPEETEEVIRIFNSKWISDIGGVPACGFGDDVAIKIGNTTWKIAKDACARTQVGVFTYNISDEDMDYIHALFEKYSGEPWDGGYN